MINEKQMTLATDYDGQSVIGWRVQEKLDGCRAYWDGLRFWTRGGNKIRTPCWMTNDLPSFPLDGEIWAGRGGLEIARRAVQYNEWKKGITFQVFDAPKAEGDWVDRILEACEEVRYCEHASVLDYRQVKNMPHLLAEFLAVTDNGGEGLMLRNPSMTYEIGRSKNLLKIKAAHPAMFL